jgi:hypothetical protein
VGVIQHFFSSGQNRLTCEVPTFSGENISQTDDCTDWVLIPKKS